MNDLFSQITKQSISAYQERLANVLKLSPATVNRRISALRKFCAWAEKEGYLKENPFALPKKEIKRIRVKVPRYLDKLRSSIPSIPYLGNAYKIYHSITITNYLHYAVLIIFCAALGFGFYQQFFARAPEPLAFPAEEIRPKRYLSFQGRLTDSSDNPISSATDMRFRLYDADSGGNTLWDSGVTPCSITPDQDGIFSILLGSDCGSEIASSVFSENAEVWLGIKIDTDSEATPRIQVATVAYALNAETLQGFPLASATSGTPDATMGATARTVPALNPAGNLVIAATSPTLWSTSGTFAIKGQALSIVTDTGTDGNITLAPDGTGTVNINVGGTGPGNQVRITDANIVSGNLVSVYAGTDTTGFDLLNLSSGASETTVFSVDESGNTYSAGSVGVGTTNPGTSLDVVGGNIRTDADIYGGDLYLGYDDTSATITTSDNENLTLDPNSTGDIYFHGSTYYIDDSSLAYLSGLATTNYTPTAGEIRANVFRDGNSNYYIQPADTTTAGVFAGNIGIGTTAPAMELDIAGDATLSGTLSLGPQVQAYAGTCNAAAEGKMYYDNAQDEYYYCDGSSWKAVAAGSSSVSGSGTQNYIPKWTGSTTLGDSVMYDDGTNIGIGTTGPTYKLDVSGTGRFTGNVDVQNGLDVTNASLTVAGSYSWNTSGQITAATDETINGLDINAGAISDVTGYTQASGAFAFSGAGNFSVDSAAFAVTTAGAVSGVTTLSMSNQLTNSYANTAAINLTGNGAGITFTGTGPNQIITAASQNLALMPGGNVGIGTTAPGQELDVVGDIQLTENILMTDDNYIGISANERIVFDTAGDIEIMGAEVGIGTTAPSMELDIAGDATLSGTLSLGPQVQAYAGTCNASAEGKMYYDNAQDEYYYCDGSSWKAVAAGSSSVSGSGTQNYIPKWTGSTTLGDSVMYDDGTNVGIGTTGPGAKLDVVGGSIRTDADLYGGDLYLGYDDTSATITTNDAENLTLDPNSTGDIYFHGSTYYLDDSSLAYLSGLATTNYTPTAGEIRADVFRDGNSNYYIQPADTTTAGVFAGNVGIGTTGPTNKLHVVGSIYQADSSSTIQSAGTIQANAGTTFGIITTGAPMVVWNGVDYKGYSDGGSTQTVHIETGSGNSYFNAGNVGIGTTAPSMELDIAGDATLSGTLSLGPQVQAYAGTCNAAAEGKMYYDNDNDEYYYCDGSSWKAVASGSTGVSGSGSAGQVAFWDGSSSISGDNAFWWDNSSKEVGIGTTNPGAKLDVVGNILVQGGGSLDVRSAGTLTIGGTTQTGLTLGQSGATTSLIGSNVTLGGLAYGGASNTLAFTSALTGMLKGNNTSAPSAVTSTANYVTYWSDNNTISGEQYLATSRGGLGANVTAAGAGEILYSTATTTYGHLAAGTSGMALLSGGAGAPSWGTLGLTYGGTNANLSGVATGGLIYKAASALAGTGALSGILQGNGASAPSAITGTANYIPKWSSSAPYLTATSLLYDDGTNVGIGTTGPTQKFEVDGNMEMSDDGGVFYLSRSNTDYGHIGAGSQVVTGSAITDLGINAVNNMVFGISNVEKMRIDSNGNVGIGTTGPGAKLHVSGGNILLDNTYGLQAKDAGETIRGLAKVNVGDDIEIGDQYLDDITFHVGNLNYAVTIKETSGNVGIGTTGPSGKLQVVGDEVRIGDSGTPGYATGDGDLYIEDVLEVDGVIYADGGISGYPDGSGTQNYIPKWQDSDTLTDSVIFETGGNIGIGTTGPSYLLDVTGVVGANEFRDRGTAYYLDPASNPSLLVAGNVGIGTTGPVGALDVNGKMYLSGKGFADYDSSGDGIRIGAVESAYKSSYLAFRTEDTEQMRIDSSGNISITGDLTVNGGRVTFGNSEYIHNETDDFIEFQGAGGTDNTDIRVDLDGTYPVWNSPTDTTIGFAEDVDITGHLALADDAISSTQVLAITESYTSDAATYGIYNQVTNTATLTADRSRYGIFNRIYAQDTEDPGLGYDSFNYALYSLAQNQAGYTANRLWGVYGIGNNVATAGTVDDVRGVYGKAQMNAVGGTVANAYGVFGSASEAAGTMTTGYGGYFSCSGATTCYGVRGGDGTTTGFLGYQGTYGVYTENNAFLAGTTYLGTTSYYVDTSGNAKFLDLIAADTGNPGLTVGNGTTGYIKVGGSTIYDAAGDLTLNSDSAQTVVTDNLTVSGELAVDGTSQSYIKGPLTVNTSNYVVGIELYVSGDTDITGSLLVGSGAGHDEYISICYDTTQNTTTGTGWVEAQTGNNFCMLRTFNPGPYTSAILHAHVKEDSGCTNCKYRLYNNTDSVAECTSADITNTSWTWGKTTGCTLDNGQNNNYEVEIRADGTNTMYFRAAYLELEFSSADIAEYIPAEEGIESADIVSIDPTSDKKVILARKPYDPTLIGTITTTPGMIIGANKDELLADPTLPEELREILEKKPIALAGRVPTKVSTINGPIKRGDPITSSGIPGVGMKATKAGPIVGKALQDYINDDSNAIGEIVVFIMPSYYLGELTDNGMVDEEFAGIERVEIAESSEEIISPIPESEIASESATSVQEPTISLVEEIENLRLQIASASAISRIAADWLKATWMKTELLTAKVAEIAKAKVESLVVEEKLVSPLVETEQLTAISIQATESRFGKLISTQIETDRLQVNADATVAGTLHVKKIVAEEIVGLKGRFGELITATVSAEKIQGLEERLAQLEATPSPTLSPEPVVEEEPLATESGQFLADVDIETMVDEILNSSLDTFPQADLTDIKGEDLKIANSLTVLGTTSLADTSVAGNLSVDGTLTISGNSIDTLTDTLYLQSLGLGGVDILAGKIVIDGSGNLTVSGDVTVKGSLFANIISPLPEQDLTIDLKQKTADETQDSGFGKLIVKGVEGEVVASIEASGTSTFKKLAIAKAEEEVTQVSETEIETNATAGKAVLPDGETEITIKSQFVTDKTMIYVTPTSNTQNKVLFVKAKKGATEEEIGWFKVGIDVAIDADIQFNWWIIN